MPPALSPKKDHVGAGALTRPAERSSARTENSAWQTLFYAEIQARTRRAALARPDEGVRACVNRRCAAKMLQLKPMSAPESRFVKACRSLAVDRTPVWFMRQAGRYMPEYRAVRKQYSLIEICKRPEVAAEVTITAAEALGVDAAIIFADLLLPLEVMGLPFHFSPGEGPVIEKPVRDQADISQLRTDRAADLGYVAQAVRLVSKHFGARLPVIGFCGAPFTLASYMIEGGSSRNYVNTKKMMYSAPAAWDELLGKLVTVVAEYAAEQVRAGADVIQVFDSWVGCLSVQDYRRYVLPRTTELVKGVAEGRSANHLFWH